MPLRHIDYFIELIHIIISHYFFLWAFSLDYFLSHYASPSFHIISLSLASLLLSSLLILNIDITIIAFFSFSSSLLSFRHFSIFTFRFHFSMLASIIAFSLRCFFFFISFSLFSDILLLLIDIIIDTDTDYVILGFLRRFFDYIDISYYFDVFDIFFVFLIFFAISFILRQYFIDHWLLASLPLHTLPSHWYYFSFIFFRHIFGFIITTPLILLMILIQDYFSPLIIDIEGHY